MTRFARFKKRYVESEEFKVTPLKQQQDNNYKKFKTDGPNRGDGNGQDSRSFQRREKRKTDRDSKMVCFSCRKPGHSVKDCIEGTGADTLLEEESIRKSLVETGICYHCGTMEHTSKSCDHPNRKKSPFKFATCFLCSESGHLASKCEKNEKGLYPNGGGCKFCNSVEHFAKDCNPTKTKDSDAIELGKIDLEQGADDDDVFLALHKMQKSIAKPVKVQPKKNKPKVVKF